MKWATFTPLSILLFGLPLDVITLGPVKKMPARTLVMLFLLVVSIVPEPSGATMVAIQVLSRASKALQLHFRMGHGWVVGLTSSSQSILCHLAYPWEISA